MRVLAVGDPHGNLDKIKEIPLRGIDLILLTGDLGKADLARKFAFENIKRKQQGLPVLKYTPKERRDFHNEIHNSILAVLKCLSNHAPVYSIQGNISIPTRSMVKKYHEKYGLNLISTREQLNKLGNVSIVKNRLRVLYGLRVGFLEYFTDISWVKEFKPNDYQKAMRRAKKQTAKARRVLKSFGSNLPILICHQPPFGFLDKVSFPGAPEHWKGKHAGSKAVLGYIQEQHPRYVFCGHIHEGEGMVRIGKTEVYNLGVGGHKIIEI